MRLPVTSQLSTKDGISNKNARLTNTLKESAAQGEFAVSRPGLDKTGSSTGNGKGIVSFNNTLLSIYGSNLLAWGAPVTSIRSIIPGPTYSLTTASAYGNGRFCVIGDDDSSATTTDGVTWSSGSLSYFEWTDIASNGAIFVAVGSGAKKIAYSSDGISWSYSSISTNFGYGTRVVWNGTIFCIMDGVNRTTLTSTDGIAWTTHTNSMPSSGVVYACWSGANFVAVKVNSPDFHTSSDGIVWVSGTLPFSENWTGIAAKDGLVIIINPIGETLRSTDLVNWAYGFVSIDFDGFTDIEAGDNYFMCCPNPYGSSTGWDVAYVSEDGGSWTEVALGSEAYLKDGIATDGVKFLIMDEENVAFYVDPRLLVPIQASAITGDFFDFAQSTL